MASVDLLLVEDNPGDIRLTQEAFAECALQYRLSVAYDGEMALEMLFKKNNYRELPSPQLILLDLNLPKRNGREVLKEIKQHPQLKSTPVIVLSTSNAEEDIANCYGLHANCYLTKPVNYSDFIGVVREIERFWFNLVQLPPSTHVEKF